MNNVGFAFLLTLIAGLSTCIGGIIALSTKKDNKTFLSFSLGFSAGVMIYVSFVEIFQKSLNELITFHGEKIGTWITVIAFFGGIALIAFIDFMMPKEHNPHEFDNLDDVKSESSLMRMGIFTALAIAIHNFPEGIATFVTALQDINLALPIVIAIALHNIPEGIAVAAPIYHATGSKSKAFFFSFLSGIAEPVGALLAWLVLMPFLNETLFGIIYAGVAGIMVFISIDELLPAARAYDKYHLSIFGFILGMAFMALSLLLFL